MAEISNKRSFVAFLDENGKKVEGYFEIVSESPRLKIKSGKNILTIPESRLLSFMILVQVILHFGFGYGGRQYLC